MQDVERNEILFMPLLAEAVLMVNAPLFDIESGNTIESRIQAVSTENGNEFTIQKLATESTLLTKVAEGQVVFTSNPVAEGKQEHDPLVAIFLRA